ncbi:MAG: hypothetical protein J6Y91_03295 [Alphaproteobacteria bacterium]|nr:hypothetical protein [Alphaproteobacteria bacterium]
MELYLFIALLFMYLITAVAGTEITVRRIWTSAFILSFLLSAVTLFFMKLDNEEMMMKAETFNWCYLLYMFGSLCLALGCINLWMYRAGLRQILLNKEETPKE